MKKLCLTFGMLCIVSLLANEEDHNSGSSTQRRASFATKRLVEIFATKRLVEIAKTGSTSDILKYVQIAKKKNGSPNDQLEDGFHHAFMEREELSTWNLARASQKQEDAWNYNLKSFGWAVGGFAAGAATMWLCHNYLPQSKSQQSKPQ